MARVKKTKKLGRSLAGNILIYGVLVLFGLFMLMPMIYAINSAFKPLDELFVFPPKFFVQNPTLDNFADLNTIMSQSWVPFSRYLFNTVFITAVGTAGCVVITSMAAFVLAKFKFPGSKIIFRIVTTALMFSGYVTQIPNYLIMAKLGWIDTYLAMIVPAFGMPLGLFLTKQYMENIPDALIEAARLDGANLWKVFWKIIMPNTRPAWLTVTILSVQALWNSKAIQYIHSEDLKTLPYALQQILGGGVSRTGVGSAVTVIMMIVPIVTFIMSQRSITETMASSGIKE
ncbi:MAG: carbohydrate ABC transporter permease [Lachnospiraceae bacterium]|nr:carbohydrate ABC transporter permease [Lachnospiraceae bacterium]MBR6271204.1 carbohydrate ABC transporter permease [Lachnospiraceae bacterium]